MNNEYEIDPILGMILFDSTVGLESTDSDETPPTPVAQFFEDAKLDAALRKSTQGSDPHWDEEIGRPMDGSIVSSFAKGTLGHSLGIVRVEEKEVNGEKWFNGYDSAGVLVDARVSD